MASRQVTRLRFQRKNPERVNVYLDGAYAFSLPAVEAAHLHKGQVLTQEEIEELKDRDALQQAYDRALRFLSYRPRSRWEVRQYLARKGEPEGRVEAVMQRLQESGWVDDEAFARFWVENRQAFRPRGQRALRYELRRKGVADDIIEAVVAEVDEEGAVMRLARRRARRWKDLEYPVFRRRMLGYLMRRGFGYAEASEAMQRAWDDVGSERDSRVG